MSYIPLQVLKMQRGSRPHQHHPSSLRGASWSKSIIRSDCTTFEGNKRRGNLPSLTNWREFFNGYKTTSQQVQSREIASGMQQRLAALLFTTHSAKPRNDEVWWERGELQTFQKGNVCES